ncbi:MAG: hypothetical protein IPM51_01325 [Sphingobacteriaceae bacterium]|nr:hypothetical protein [Sphingobacteriaceae bacterium]
MKKLLITLVLLGSVLFGKAQVPTNITNGTWQSAVLRADGATSVEGVESYCMKVTCNNEEFIVIKFKNTNNYKVAVEWTDAIYYNGNWNPSTGTKKIYVDANSESIGDCNGNIKLKLGVNSIISFPAGLGHYSTMGLTVKQ